MKRRHLGMAVAMPVIVLFAAPAWGQLPKMPVPMPLPAPAPKPVPAPAPAPKPTAPVLVQPAVPTTAPAVVVVPKSAEPVSKPAMVVPVAPMLAGAAKPTPAEPVGKPALVAPVIGPGATASVATAAAGPTPAEPVGRGILLNPIATPSSKLSGAKVDAGNIKQKVDSSDLKIGAPERKGGLADVAREHAQNLGGDDKTNPSKFGDKSGLMGSNVVTGSDADTFGGERANRGKTGDTRNFAGSGKGRASEGDPTTESAQDQATGGKGTIGEMLRMEGGTPSGNDQADAAELAYAQSVGSDGYAATKNMTQEQRQSYWTEQKNKQQAGTPREDDMGGGNVTLVGTPQMKQQQMKGIGKAIAARKGAAGGNDDPRMERGGSGGPVRQMVGQDDKPQRSREAGTINLDKVLEINTKVNPTRQ
ncbi:MAG: hypothetical protein AB1513_03050 [Pseudomonadota bacterium]